jgi:transcriptional regulator
MYLPKQFAQAKPEHTLRIIQEHPLASLIGNDEQGFPYVTHLPIHASETDDSGAPSLLLGHLAKANPQAQFLIDRPAALLTFLGPHAYMSPSVYPDIQRVPTWNYLAVHVRVKARLLPQEQAKDALLKMLIADHEPAYAQQWRSLVESYTHAMLQAIVAFEFDVEHIETKIKLNQHRPESHQAMHQQYLKGSPNEQKLAAWMIDLGMVDQQ